MASRNEINVLGNESLGMKEEFELNEEVLDEIHRPQIREFLIGTSVGKRIRLRRIFDPSGAILAVPLDHGFTLGPIAGLLEPHKTVKQVVNGGASCVIIHKGLVRVVHNALRRNVAFLVHVSGSTNFSPRTSRKIQISTVTEALRLGADGVSCHINLGASEDVEMLQDFAELTRTADELGVPVLAMMYVRDDNGKERTDPVALAHAARVAEEAGADIVKISATPDGKDFDEVTQGIHIPIVIAGGAKKNDFGAFLQTVKRCVSAGAAGVSVGRNIFQASNPQVAMKKVADAVKEAMKSGE